MNTFKMRWSALNLEVVCDGIAKNEAAMDAFAANMPVKALQGHEMVGGWMLRDRAVHLRRRPFQVDPAQLESEKMRDAPIGRIFLLSPQGGSTEVLVKYDQCVDDRDFIPVAQVRPEWLEVLRRVGKAQWQSASRTKEIYHVEFVEVH